jgi:hypothetical protein
MVYMRKPLEWLHKVGRKEKRKEQFTRKKKEAKETRDGGRMAWEY